MYGINETDGGTLDMAAEGDPADVDPVGDALKSGLGCL
jgi:hypothetical protein